MSNPTDPNEEFDRLFNDTGAPATPTGDQETDTAAAAGEQPPVEPPPTGDAAGDGSAPAPEGEAGGASPDDAGADDRTGADEDWEAQLPEQVRERLQAERNAAKAERDALEQRYRALHGRLSPTQQALSDAQRRLAQIEQAPPKAPSSTSTQAELDSYFDSEAWKQWANDFPSDAKVYRDGLEIQRRESRGAIEQLSEQVRTLQARLDQTDQTTAQRALETEVEKLEAKHADWQQLNESQEFWDWFYGGHVPTLPKSLQAIYRDDQQLKTLFNDADFTIDILDRYKATLQPATPPVTPPVETPPEPPAQKPAKAKLDMSINPEVRGSGGRAPDAVRLEDLPPEQQFDYLYEHASQRIV